jgi:hypothetical protein
MPLNLWASVSNKTGIMESASDILYWLLPGVGRMDATTEAKIAIGRQILYTGFGQPD